MEQPCNVFALDVETTTSNKGNPFDETNHLVLGGYGTNTIFNRFLPGDEQGVSVSLEKASLVLFFNAKFDLHWLRRIGVTFSIRLPIWDCQLAEYILSNQRWKYPSLEEACSKRGLGHKIDVIKQNYWDKGIDTDAIPLEELEAYLKQDVSLTYLLYLAQMEEFKKEEHKGKYKLFRISCYDLLVLEEMEFNGYKFDSENARKQALLLEKECETLDNAILSSFPDVPINLGSPDHISVMLYGGTITDDTKVPIGVYKTGAKVGHTRYKIVEQTYVLPRIIEPLKGSELAKEGYYGTGEDVLKTLKTDGRSKEIIGKLLDRRGLTKLTGTYYNGVPTLIEKYNWAEHLVHGTLNQCVTITGRLSASKPNQQNMPSGCKQYCVSRYE